MNNTKLKLKERAGCDGPRRSVAVRSYPSPKVRGSEWERQAATAQERRPEELPHVRGQGRLPGRDTTRRRSGAAAERIYPTREVRGPTQEELPHLQGAAALPEQEDREELLRVQGQEGRLWEIYPFSKT